MKEEEEAEGTGTRGALPAREESLVLEVAGSRPRWSEGGEKQRWLTSKSFPPLCRWSRMPN